MIGVLLSVVDQCLEFVESTKALLLQLLTYIRFKSRTKGKKEILSLTYPRGCFPLSIQVLIMARFPLCPFSLFLFKDMVTNEAFSFVSLLTKQVMTEILCQRGAGTLSAQAHLPN